MYGVNVYQNKPKFRSKMTGTYISNVDNSWEKSSLQSSFELIHACLILSVFPGIKAKLLQLETGKKALPPAPPHGRAPGLKGPPARQGGQPARPASTACCLLEP